MGTLATANLLLGQHTVHDVMAVPHSLQRAGCGCRVHVDCSTTVPVTPIHVVVPKVITPGPSDLVAHTAVLNLLITSLIDIPLYLTVCQAAGPLGARPYKECRAWLPIFVPLFLATPSSHPTLPRPPARRGRVPSQGLFSIFAAPGKPRARRATPRLAPASLEIYTASDNSRTDRQPPLLSRRELVGWKARRAIAGFARTAVSSGTGGGPIFQPEAASLPRTVWPSA